MIEKINNLDGELIFSLLVFILCLSSLFLSLSVIIKNSGLCYLFSCIAILSFILINAIIILGIVENIRYKKGM
jgi:hypothetical protein